MGEEGKPEWILVTQEVLDSLVSARMDVLVTEAVDTLTARERQFVQVKELFQTIGPMLPPDVIITTMLEYSSIEQETKSKILGMLPAIQQYQQQQAQQANMAKMEQSVQNSVLRKQMKDQLEQQQAAPASQQAANPTLGGI
jgi:ABC-type lipoprotein release transport system permease subunit